MSSTEGYYGDALDATLPNRTRMSTCYMCLQYKEHAGVFDLYAVCMDCYLTLKDVMTEKRNKELIRIKMRNKK